jgi:hypothetical protein
VKRPAKAAKTATRRTKKVDPVTDLVGAYNLGGRATEAARDVLTGLMVTKRSPAEHRDMLMMVRMMIDAAIVEGTAMVMSPPPAGTTHMLALAQRLTMITYDRLADTDGPEVFFRALADMFAKSATVCGETSS